MVYTSTNQSAQRMVMEMTMLVGQVRLLAKGGCMSKIHRLALFIHQDIIPGFLAVNLMCKFQECSFDRHVWSHTCAKILWWRVAFSTTRCVSAAEEMSWWSNIIENWLFSNSHVCTIVTKHCKQCHSVLFRAWQHQCLMQSATGAIAGPTVHHWANVFTT